ncbi:signal peptide peptidase SppA [Propionibacteriaceae bacterium Y2011]|uniref:signal peptide peptidase SppA n=1 Tax=Microlunatus sp. Y2014 TaxID=3418488 RepID=UPI003B46A8C7
MDLTQTPLRGLLPAQPPTVLELDLSRGILSGAPASPRDALRALQAPTMRSIRDGLREAAKDERVAGLVINIGDCPLTAGQVDELAELITRFGEHRPTVAHTSSFGELTNGLFGYRLASHCHQIWLQPSGSVGIQGVALGVTLFRGTLDKVGVEPEFGQRHEYKTAANQFAAHEVTEPQREMMQRIADSVLAETVTRVAERRSLPPEAVRAAVDSAPLTAAEALEHKLIDRIGYRDEVYGWLTENWGKIIPAAPRPWRPEPDEGPQVRLQYVHRYAKQGFGGAAQQLAARSKPAIAVVGVQGGIVTGQSQRSAFGGQQAGADTVAAQLRAAGRDSGVKAVILRVDSPGGSYVASDAIRREVVRLRESGRPVVATMGDVAASGGYFVSMAADEIVVNPTTLTGSIGVLAGKFVTTGLTDRIGLVREELAAGARARMFSNLETFTDDHWQTLDRWLDEVYADFTTKAATDRKMPHATLEPLARGRVWTGADAVQHQLADRLGGMDTAIDRVCTLAGLDRDDAVLRTGPGFPFLAQLRPAESSESGHTDTRLADDLLAGGPALGTLAGTGGLEALWRQAAEALGVAAPGVLSLPFVPQLR